MGELLRQKAMEALNNTVHDAEFQTDFDALPTGRAEKINDSIRAELRNTLNNTIIVTKNDSSGIKGSSNNAVL